MALEENDVMWGAASMMLDRHGADAPRKVAERIGALAIEGDTLSIAAWTRIAQCMDDLMCQSRH